LGLWALNLRAAVSVCLSQWPIFIVGADTVQPVPRSGMLDYVFFRKR
jgi:hypothetical protein